MKGRVENMKKSVVTALAVAALGVGVVGAANPFTDVTPSDWAYQSVSQLAAAGVINGYPDGTFQGQKNITRYEMAQMVAKAMANEGRANAEQQAMINRLADEFSGELNNLGVRVANLENKVGNVKITGDARMRYRGSEKEGQLRSDAAHKHSKSWFDFRARVQFTATVNDSTTATLRVRTGDTGDYEFGDAKNSGSVAFDRAYVAHKFGKDTTVNVGRYGVVIGEGLIYNDEPLDGIGISQNWGKVNLSVNHGKMTSYYASTYAYGPKGFTWNKIQKGADGLDADANPSVTILQARADFNKNLRVDGYYILGHDDLPFDVWGAALNAKVTDKVWLGGEYVKMTNIDDTEKAKLDKGTSGWVAGIGYGDYNMGKQGTWDVKMQYFREGESTPIFTSRWAQLKPRDFKGWLATVDYALYKNVGFTAYYGFNNKKVSNGDSYGDYYRAELNFKF